MPIILTRPAAPKHPNQVPIHTATCTPITTSTKLVNFSMTVFFIDPGMVVVICSNSEAQRKRSQTQNSFPEAEHSRLLDIDTQMAPEYSRNID